MCWLCFGTSTAVGYLSSQLGFEAPKTRNGAILSGVLTGALTGITTIALKSIFDTPICGGITRSLMHRVVSATMYAAPIAIIYSLSLNYLIAHYIEPSFFQPDNSTCCNSNSQTQDNAQPKEDCHCSQNK